MEMNALGQRGGQLQELLVSESGFTSSGAEGLYVLVAGELTVGEKDKLIHMRAGELLFVKRGTFVVSNHWQDCQLLWLSLDSAFVQEFMRRHGDDLVKIDRNIESFANFLHFQEEASIADCVARIVSSQNQKALPMLTLLRVEELLLHLLFGPQGAMLLTALRHQGNRHVDRLHAFMEKNFLQEWRLDEFCKEFGLGLTAFKAMFYVVYNCSPRAWISERRILHSRNLLLNTDMSIVDVAMESGFSSQSYFSQSYRRRFGCTPSEARKHP